LKAFFAWLQMATQVPSSSATGKMPVVDYALLGQGRRLEFLQQLHAALSDVGSLCWPTPR
jgi:hypothetical protein